MKGHLVSVVRCIIVLPILPVYCLQQACLFVIHVCDWIMGRSWASALLQAQESFAVWSESADDRVEHEYQSWRHRMGFDK